MKKDLKIGLLLIILGNLLYLVYIFFTGNEKGTFSDFSSGLLLGITIGCELVGVILTVKNIPKDDGENRK